MANDNFVQIVGSLGGDPELRFTTAGVAVCSFSVAWTARKKDPAGGWVDGETTWFRCTAWRDMAENVAASLSKGMRVVVTGQISARDWVDNESNNRTSIEIQVDEASPSLRWAQAHIERNEREKPAETRQAAAKEPAYDDTEEPF